MEKIRKKKEDQEKDLRKDRILLLVGKITREKAMYIRRQLLSLNIQSKEEIKLMIDSPGGEVVAALLLYDTILLSSAPVTCIVNGKCSSSGVAILQGAKKRLATKHSFFYLHPVAISFEREPITVDKMAEKKFREKLKAAKERQRFIYEILIKRTGRSLKEIKAKEEKIIFAQEAKDFGLIDEVIEEYKLLS